MGFKDFLFGERGKYKQQSMLSPEQQQLWQQLNAAMQGQGAGGAWGQAADYYRDLLSDDSDTFNAMMAPEMRRFNEDIIPGLAEQFAGMGSGGLSSSGFRNAGIQAGTDLQERLGSLRAQLRQQGAAGLMGLGQQAMMPTVQNIFKKPRQGFLEQLAPLAVSGGMMAMGMPPMGGMGMGGGFGQSSPYGRGGY